MANLNDISIADVGIIAFWNAHDHLADGPSVIDPTDCVSYFSDGGYSVYDNGIEGYKPLGSGRYFNIRIKNDGWMIAWVDRTNTYAIPSGTFGEASNKGYYDILWNWRAYDGLSASYTTLSYIITQLYNLLSNKTSFTFSLSDVGHYCYEFQNANVFTLSCNYSYCSCGWHEQKNCYHNDYLQYTSGTNLWYAALVTTGRFSGTHADSRGTGFITFDENAVFSMSYDDHGTVYAYSACNILPMLVAPNIDYVTYTYRYVYYSSSLAFTHSFLLLWS